MHRSASGGRRVAVAAVHGGRMREADQRPAAGTRVLQRARMITTALAELDAGAFRKRAVLASARHLHL